MTTGSDGITAAYRPLYEYLVAAPNGDVVLSVSDVESIIGFELPDRARADPHWWKSTPRNSWARSWLRADLRATLDPDEQSVLFTHEVFAPVLDFDEVRRVHQMEAAYAREQLGYLPSSMHVRLHWWEPHIVYIVHVHAEGLFKVGHTRSARRLKDLTAHGRSTVVQRIELPNLWAAKIVEGEVLALTDSARRFADPFDSRNGQTEHWDDEMPPPDLAEVAAAFSDDRSLTYWRVSLSRAEGEHLWNRKSQTGSFVGSAGARTAASPQVGLS